MVVQPTGTVTLLFTDVEGSTALLAEVGAERYSTVLALHRELLRGAFAAHGGYEVDEEGDALFVVFAGAGDAVAAAADAQRALAAAEWPEGCDGVRVRIGVHTGEPLAVPPKYVGMDVHRAARIMAAAHGGQVVVSETTAALVDGGLLRDLGPHRLKDMLGPIRLYQVEIDGLSDEFPPLRSLHQTNLPVAAWPLLGREQELEAIASLIADGVRLVTLTGPGGSGKTRLALQAAADLSERFVDGVFFVALAPVRQVETVPGTVAEAIGLQPDDDVTAWLASRRALLVLDNLEHLPRVDALVAELLVGGTTILATSRTPLHLAAERESPVEPLADEAAVELFASRAAAAGRTVELDETVAAVCRRLDNLPLALELAASRAKLLAPAALLERLDAALPLLTGGASDRPERQRTLRATIEWSHDLLDPDAQAAFRRLSVFRGSFTLDAAEAVADANLDQVAALLDQSLTKPLGDERFFLLETIREFARDQLNGAGETREYAMRHAHFYLARLERDEPELWGPRRSELLTWWRAEEDNMRAMLDRLIAEAIEDAPEAIRLLHRYWGAHGAFTEERQRIEALLSNPDMPREGRAMLYGILADVAMFVGDMDALEPAAHEALRLSTAGETTHAIALLHLGMVAARRGRNDEAIRFARQVLDEADLLTPDRRLWLRGDAAVVLADSGQIEEARALTRECRDECKRRGFDLDVAMNSGNLAQFDLSELDYEAARAGLAGVLVDARRLGVYTLEAETLRDLGYALLGLRRRSEARAAFGELLELATREGPIASVQLFAGLAGIGLTAEPDDFNSARLRGALDQLRQATNIRNDAQNERLDREFELQLIGTYDAETWAREYAAGATMTLDEAIELARSLATGGSKPARTHS